MTLETRTFRTLLGAVALLAAFSMGQPVRAQDDGFDDLEAPSASPVQAHQAQVQAQFQAQAVQAQVQVQFMQAEANFDATIFGNLGNSIAARQRVETQLKLQIDEVDRVARLTE